MVSRFLSGLEDTERQKFTAEIKEFVLEVLYTKYGKISYSNAYLSPRDALPNFNIRIELKNVRTTDGQKIKVSDATIPFSAYFKHHGFPKPGDQIEFIARLAIKNGQEKALKYVNSISYLNSLSQLRMNLKHHDSYDLALWGYLQSVFPTKVVKNQIGNIKSFNSSKQNTLRKTCSYKLRKYINRYLNSDFQELRLSILKQHQIKRYRNIDDESDIIYIQKDKIKNENEVNKIVLEQLKNTFSNLSKNDFCKMYVDEDKTVDLSVPALYESIKASLTSKGDA